MYKHLFLAMAVLTPTLYAPQAMALRTDRTYRVQLEGLPVGTWRLRNRVVETSLACRYTVMWSNLPGPPLGRTTLCRIDEYRASDNFDCEVNRRTFFDTLVAKAPGRCHGFDDFGQQTSISTMVAGEDSSGVLNGILVSASVGDVQSFEVR
ncbi:MAG: hypothetical protein RMK29_06470 [Myxococcales bacterium]|nr:hypothetical protein [Myxococcota bacterium]MDW8281337.1 hypothetical protein [Myxococcales bacterium]